MGQPLGVGEMGGFFVLHCVVLGLSVTTKPPPLKKHFLISRQCFSLHCQLVVVPWDSCRNTRKYFLLFMSISIPDTFTFPADSFLLSGSPSIPWRASIGGQWPPGQISMQEMQVQKPLKVSLIASSWLIKLGFRPKSRGPWQQRRRHKMCWSGTFSAESIWWGAAFLPSVAGRRDKAFQEPGHRWWLGALETHCLLCVVT